MEYINFI